MRARVKPKAPRAKEERRDRRRKRGKGQGGGRNDGRRESAKRNGGGAGASADSAAGSAAGGGSSTDARPAKQRNKKRSSGSRSDAPARSNERQQKEDASMDDVRTCVDEFLNGLTDAFGIDTTVTIDTDEEEIRARIEGKHGLLLGPKARTLDAIQELTRVTAQRTAPSSIRIKVDVGGYRDARREALARFANDAAEKARAEQIEVSLEPMTSADRKVVHDALTDADGVSTRSAGTDPRRYVIVVPDVAESADHGGDDVDDDAASTEPAGASADD